MKKLFEKFKRMNHGRRESEEKNKGWKKANEEFIYLSQPMDNGQIKPVTQQQKNMQDFLQIGAACVQLRKRPEQNGQALREIQKKVELNSHSKKSSSHVSVKEHKTSHLYR